MNGLLCFNKCLEEMHHDKHILQNMFKVGQTGKQAVTCLPLYCKSKHTDRPQGENNNYLLFGTINYNPTTYCKGKEQERRQQWRVLQSLARGDGLPHWGGTLPQQVLFASVAELLDGVGVDDLPGGTAGPPGGGLSPTMKHNVSKTVWLKKSQALPVYLLSASTV